MYKTKEELQADFEALLNEVDEFKADFGALLLRVDDLKARIIQSGIDTTDSVIHKDDVPVPEPEPEPEPPDEYDQPFTIGETDVQGGRTSIPHLRANKYIVPRDGVIKKLSIYHDAGGTGKMALAVYRDNGGPAQLASYGEKVVNAQAGWDTVDVTTIAVTKGEVIWLAWLFENSIGLRIVSDPNISRAHKGTTWADGLPDPYGSHSIDHWKYSIYARCLGKQSDGGGTTPPPPSSNEFPMLRGFNVTSSHALLEDEIRLAKEVNANWMRTRILMKPADGGLAAGMNAKIAELLPKLEWFRKYKMPVVLSIRDDGSGFWPGSPYKDESSYWQSITTGSQKDLVPNAYKKLAQAVLPYSDVVLGFYLLGEPLDRAAMPNPPLNYELLAQRIVNAIRTVDSKSWIFHQPGPGGVHWSWDSLTVLNDPQKRIVMDIHHYLSHIFTHQGVVGGDTGIEQGREEIGVRYPTPYVTTWETAGYANAVLPVPSNLRTYFNKAMMQWMLGPALRFREKYGTPLACLEWATVRWSPVPDGAVWTRESIEFFEENNIAWLYHGWGKSDNHWGMTLPEGTSNYWHPSMGWNLPWPAWPDGYIAACWKSTRGKVVLEALKKNLL